MKNYRQIYLIVKDRSFKYEQVPDTPDFHKEEDALAYWDYNNKSIKDCNFYNDPIVLVRREINTTKIKKLT